MDIAEFLTARYVEEERIARAAVGRYADGSAWGPSWTYDRENFRVLIDGQAAVAAENTSDVDGEHIARHDPARVLADIAAKRSIIEDYLVVRANSEIEKVTDRGAMSDFRSSLEDLIAGTLKMVLRRFAAVFADHPDYDPAWRIDG